MKTILFFCLGAVVVAYIVFWMWAARAAAERMPRLDQLLVGFFTNFLDTLGIGSFATTSSIYKLRHMVADDLIPGTMNVGHALPIAVQAFIYITVIDVDATTLITMIACSVAGAWSAAMLVSGSSRRTVQLGMGVALLAAAVFLVAGQSGLVPSGGEAVALRGSKLAAAAAVNFLLGALSPLGVGLYAPCLILVTVLGMSPRAAFPIMMGSCAFLVPAAACEFLKRSRYDARAAVALAIAGIPGVLIAAFVVKSLPLGMLRWLVIVAVLYAGVTMLRSAREPVRRYDGA